MIFLLFVILAVAGLAAAGRRTASRQVDEMLAGERDRHPEGEVGS